MRCKFIEVLTCACWQQCTITQPWN